MGRIDSESRRSRGVLTSPEKRTVHQRPREHSSLDLRHDQVDELPFGLGADHQAERELLLERDLPTLIHGHPTLRLSEGERRTETKAGCHQNSREELEVSTKSHGARAPREKGNWGADCSG